MKIKFKKWNCTLVATYYRSGTDISPRKALMLIDAEDASPVATATINMPDHPCKDDQVYIKDYSENKGILQTLIDYKIINLKPIDYVQAGFVTISLMKLTPKGMKLWKTKN